jgi:hypothetical protein
MPIHPQFLLTQPNHAPLTVTCSEAKILNHVDPSTNPFHATKSCTVNGNKLGSKAPEPCQSFFLTTKSRTVNGNKLSEAKLLNLVDPTFSQPNHAPLMATNYQKQSS